MSAGLEVQGRLGDRGRVAGRHRRQGQRRRRQQRRQHQGLDRLRRVRLRQAEQADLRQDDQQGRQDGCADLGGLPGRRRQRRLESVPGYGVILSDQPGAESWPMTAATFILIHKQPQDPAAAAEALKFFAWAYAKGGKMAEELDYVPMPDRGRRHRREDVGQRHQGRRRQAAVRELSDRSRGRRRRRLPRQLPHRIRPRVALSGAPPPT